MGRALEDPSNTHFYLMSGQCYPVKTVEQIVALLEAEAGNFITVLKPVWHKTAAHSSFHILAKRNSIVYVW